MLIEHDRYFYQRKVPLDFRATIGRSKWRAPLGPDFEAAYDKLRIIKAEHDALLERLKDPEEKMNFHTDRRRKMELSEAKKQDQDEAEYEEWCHARGLKTEAEEYWEQEEQKLTSGEWEKVPEWEHAENIIEAIEHERNHPDERVLHNFPMDDDEYYDLLNSSTGDKQTDAVTVLRHNFIKLIRKKMVDPINNPRKALYSLRSTFQNAMRRAGAPKDVRRAILGHVESGAIRHYDDGPSFALLKEWVEKSDPRRPDEVNSDT